ncbi:MAG: hypothetical protein A2219_01345 [Elusimicrobia bacterium RIFOXYA2_FULL_50_26]|nr:MAG: hypothetical protein A2219_01345 [Elusimicrobia bacterium RIFOXYA2_FULL_50_26]OGS24301.1 MAG: hypothetical protein A2314_07585 [Elusimicrobia bacterium RIFOXYB2_FULL_50_12]
MEIFWRLLLAHLLTDFTFQTDFLARWKLKSIAGVLVHSLVFFVCAGALCFPEINDVWPIKEPYVALRGWLVIAILSLLHFLEDGWRVWAINRENSSDSFAFFLWDQFTHYFMLFVFAPAGGGLLPGKWVSLGIIFVLATHFSAIVIYYIQKGLRNPVQIMRKEKYYFILERFAIAAALMLPGFWALTFAVVLLMRKAVKKISFPSPFSPVNLAASPLLAITFGTLARIIFYA